MNISLFGVDNITVEELSIIKQVAQYHAKLTNVYPLCIQRKNGCSAETCHIHTLCVGSYENIDGEQKVSWATQILYHLEAIEANMILLNDFGLEF